MVLPPKEIKDIDPELKRLVKPIATAVYGKDLSGAFIITKLRDRYGEIKVKIIPSSDAINTAAFKKFLVENNVSPSIVATHSDDLQTILLQDVKDKVILVRQPGFYDNKYVLPNNTVIGSKNGKKYMLDDSENIESLEMGSRGTLLEWHTNVAIFALYSSRIMLNLCSAFSPYLLHIIKIENGGIHIYGISSNGKSTSLYVVASVQGPRENMGSWGVTDTSIEPFAAARNDMVTILDELKLLDKNPTVAAEKASLIIYKLAQGKGKKRSKNYEDYTHHWRTIILSAGEVSLTDNAKVGGVKRLLGEQVRVIDVPADAGEDMGIYESLPNGFISSNELAEKLNEATMQYYGTAQPAFLKYLTKDLLKDTKQVKTLLEENMHFFMHKHNVNTKVGHQARFAKRFALAYASGVIAVDYGVLPFTEKDVMTGISKCYWDALKASRTKEENIADAYNIVKKELKSTKFIDISNKDHGYTCEQIKAANVLKSTVQFTKPQMVKIIPSERMLELIPDDDIRQEVLNKFYLKNQYLRDSDGKATRQPTSKIKNCKLPRAYFFKPSKKK